MDAALLPTDTMGVSSHRKSPTKATIQVCNGLAGGTGGCAGRALVSSLPNIRTGENELALQPMSKVTAASASCNDHATYCVIMTLLRRRRLS